MEDSASDLHQRALGFAAAHYFIATILGFLFGALAFGFGLSDTSGGGGVLFLLFAIVGLGLELPLLIALWLLNRYTFVEANSGLIFLLMVPSSVVYGYAFATIFQSLKRDKTAPAASPSKAEGSAASFTPWSIPRYWGLAVSLLSICLFLFLTRHELRPSFGFVGKVIDENGVPVANASAELQGAFSLFGNSALTIKTGDDGLFILRRNPGRFLTVTVSKTGYYTSKQNPRNFDRNRNTPSPKELSPVIFHLHKEGSIEPLNLLRGNSGRGKPFRLAKDGNPLGVNLKTGQKAPTASADLVLQIWVEPKSESDWRYNWKYQLSVPNGGLKISTNEFDFIAPDTGYVPAQEISMRAKDLDQWQNTAESSWFLHLANGRYARINLTMYANDTPWCEIQAFVNPSGSRNLEYR